MCDDGVPHAHSDEPPAHYHPEQTEHFRVLSGQMMTRANGAVRIMREGDILDVPAGTVHSIWNARGADTVMEWIVSPALDSEHFFETLAVLANSGQTNTKGVPSLLQTALTMRHFWREFRVVSPPAWIQRVLFALLAPVSLRSGRAPTREWP